MSLRYEFTFTYFGEDLLSALSKRTKYHIERIRVWEAERIEAEKAIRDSGIDIKKYVAPWPGYRSEIQIQPSLAKRYVETEEKLEEYRRKLEEYTRFERAIHANPERNFVLDIHDVEFFGL